MRIVFMGTPEFAVPSLTALLDAGYEVAAVFTQPDRPRGRGKKLAFSPVKEEAVRRGIPVYQPEKIRKESVEDLKQLAPDLCVTAAFGQILSQEILDIPRIGTVNVHASLLPKHRGSAPIAWSILMGDRVTGITTMLTDKGLDTGDMLLKRETAIGPEETCGELTERLSRIGAELLIETVRALEDGTAVRIPQVEADMSYEPKLTKELAVLDWTGDADAIARKIRALNPWPGVTAELETGTLKLLNAVPAEGSGAPGTILTADARKGLVIAAGVGAVRITRLQAAGGKPMDSRDWLRGHPMSSGQTICPHEQGEEA